MVFPWFSYGFPMVLQPILTEGTSPEPTDAPDTTTTDDDEHPPDAACQTSLALGDLAVDLAIENDISIVDLPIDSGFGY